MMQPRLQRVPSRLQSRNSVILYMVLLQQVRRLSITTMIMITIMTMVTTITTLINWLLFPFSVPGQNREQGDKVADGGDADGGYGHISP